MVLPVTLSSSFYIYKPTICSRWALAPPKFKENILVKFPEGATPFLTLSPSSLDIRHCFHQLVCQHLQYLGGIQEITHLLIRLGELITILVVGTNGSYSLGYKE
jgi:hypothetical protein